MEKDVRVGVVGSGEISKYHIEGLVAAGGCELRAITARGTQKATDIARRYGFTSVAPDSDALFASDDMDAVVIATPVDTHAELAHEAVGHGKRVLLQKPITRTAQDGRRLVDHAHGAGALLCVSFMHRYFEEVAALRGLLQDGSLGRVYGVRVRNATPGPAWSPSYYGPAPAPGAHGVVAELGVHGIDLVGYLFGEICAVTATARQVHAERTMADGRVVKSHIDDHVLAVYEIAGDITATHEMDYAEVGGTDRFALEVYGTRGSAFLRGSRGSLALFRGEGDGAGWWIPALPSRAFGERHHRHFLDQVRGTVEPDRTAEDAVRGLCVAEAVMQSCTTGKRMEVRYR